MSSTHAVAPAGEAHITTAADREALKIQQRKRIAASQIRLSESFPFFGALLMMAPPAAQLQAAPGVPSTASTGVDHG